MGTMLLPRDRLESLARPIHDAWETADALTSEGLDRASETGKAVLESAADRLQAVAKTVGYDWTPPPALRRSRTRRRTLIFGLAALGLTLSGLAAWKATRRRGQRQQEPAAAPTEESAASSDGQARQVTAPVV